MPELSGLLVLGLALAGVQQCSGGGRSGAADIAFITRRATPATGMAWSYSTSSLQLAAKNEVEGGGPNSDQARTRQSVSISGADAKAIRGRLADASRQGHARVALQELAVLGKEGMKLRGADFASAMRACLRGGQAEAVPRLYREMKKVGIRPNQLCHLTLLKALVEIGRAKEALEVWYALSTTSLPGLKFSRKQVLVAMGAAASEGDLNQVALILERLKKPSVRAWRTYLSLCDRTGSGERAKKALAKMRAHEVVPDHACIRHVASALCQSGQYAAAVPLLMGLSAKADVATLDLMALAYAKAGRRDKLPAIERRLSRAGGSLSWPTRVALSQLALDEDGDVQRALGYLKTRARVAGGKEGRLVGEWCGRLISRDDVSDGDRLHAAYVALVQCQARLPSSALKKAVRLALAEPLGRSDVADALVAAVAAGLLEEGGSVDSMLLNRGLLGAASFGLWAQGSKLLDELDRRGEDFESDKVLRAAVRVRAGAGQAKEAIVLLGLLGGEGGQEGEEVMAAIERVQGGEGVMLTLEAEGTVNEATWRRVAAHVVEREEEQGNGAGVAELKVKLLPPLSGPSKGSGGPLDGVVGLLSAGMLEQARLRLEDLPITAEGQGKGAARAYVSMLDSLASMQGEGAEEQEVDEATVEVLEDACRRGVVVPAEALRAAFVRLSQAPHRLRVFVAARRAGWEGLETDVWQGALQAAPEARTTDALLTLARQMVVQGGMLPEGPILSAVLQTAREVEDTDLLLALAEGLLQALAGASEKKGGAKRGSKKAGAGEQASRAIEALVYAGEGQRAAAVVEQMQATGAYPDAAACEALWECFCETGDVGSALQLATDSLRAHIPISGDVVLGTLELLREEDDPSGLDAFLSLLREISAAPTKAEEPPIMADAAPAKKPRASKASRAMGPTAVPRLCLRVWEGQGAEALGEALKEVWLDKPVARVGHRPFLRFFATAMEEGRAKEAAAWFAKLRKGGRLVLRPEQVKEYEAVIKSNAGRQAKA